MADAAIQMLSLDLIDGHPDHPRVVMREDVIDGIQAALGDAFPVEHAILVRKVGGRYQIVSGHLRVEAARRKGLKVIPVRVMELDEHAAFMRLVTDNHQAELDPLDIGRHALKAARKGCGGRGKKGGRIAYAAEARYDESFIRMVCKAAEVAEETSDLAPGFRGRAKHLAAVHRAHRSLWALLVRLMFDKQWSARGTAEAATKVAVLFGKDFDPSSSPWWDVFLDPQRVATALATNADFTATKVGRLIASADATAAMFTSFRDRGVDTTTFEAEWRTWLKDNVGVDAWRPMSLEQRHEEMQNALEGRVVRIDWLCGDWREHFAKLEDGSVRAVIVDPPYGNGDGCLGRNDRFPALANNATLAGAVAELRAFLKAILRKLKIDAHVVVFCDWDCQEAFKAVLTEVGFRVRKPGVWDKGSQGLGDLDDWGDECELLLHATRGAPEAYRRSGNMFRYPKVRSRFHPTEKPVTLIEDIITRTTVRGDLIADGFGGSGTTAVAAKATGRSCWSTESIEEYFRAGEKRLEETPHTPADPAAPGADEPTDAPDPDAVVAAGGP